MLNEMLFRTPRAAGLTLLHGRGASRGAQELSIWRLRLEAGESARHQVSGEETVVVLQEGRGTFDADSVTAAVSRTSVFDEPATAAYLPPGGTFVARADSALEAILFTTPAATGSTAVIVGPADIAINQRGRANYSREVHDIFVRDPHVHRLMVGETFNQPGHWSSFPPHKHDGRDGEPTLEEIYYFRIDPPQGFGQQVQYVAGGETVAHTVRDGDVVVIPYGYHPVGAAPGYRLYYLWALAGAERKLALYEDPEHRWIHDAALKPV